jgi:hypothetical protein
MEQLQAFRQSLLSLSTHQLVELLTEKSQTLLDWDSQTKDGIRFQRLLQEIEDITEVLKFKKLEEENSNR